MKVLLLAYDLGLQGGIGTFNYELALELSKHIDVTVIIRGRLSGCRDRDKLRLCTFWSPQTPPKDVWFYTLNAQRILSLANREGSDLIHDSSSALGLLPYLDRLAPVVATVHGSPMLGYLRSLYSSLRDRARFRLFEFSHKVPSAVLSFFHKPRVGRLVFVSRSCIADALVHTPPREREELRRRSVVIYNGLSIERVRRSVDRVDSNSASVVFVSRLMEYKGGFRLVKAFVHVVEEVKDTVLHVIGEGPEGPLLRELVRKLGLEKHVIFHGWLGRRETLRVIASSRILTHPSLYESFGYVIAEAYALGKPVVAHRASYSLELVENFGAGLVVNTFDEKRYAEALMTLLTDDNLYRRLSQRALATAEEYFDIRRTAEEYLRVYREVVGE